MRVRSEDLGGPAASGTAVQMEVVSCSYGSRPSNTLEQISMITGDHISVAA